MGPIANTLVVVIALSVETWAIERQCVDFSSLVVNLDDKWVGSISRWYLPLLSREAANSVARSLVGKAPEQMNPNDVIFQSCLKSDMDKDPRSPPGTFTVSGYGGASKKFLFKPVRGWAVMDMCSAGGEFCERGYNTLTDNQSFAVSVLCMSNGDMKWITFTNVKTLPEQTKQLIFQHVENLGFKRENFIEQRWDYCPPV